MGRFARPLLVALGLACQLAIGDAGAARAAVTVTVVPFSSLESGRDPWLGKAIADVLTRQLAAVPSLEILERDRLTAFLEEMELQDSGLFSQQDAGRVGRVAKVDLVIFGNYSLRGERLEINLLLVDLELERAVRTWRTSGTLDRLHDLVAGLALDMLEHRGVLLTEAEGRNIRFAPTDSLPATRHFYEALDHYDHGRYEDAFGAFYAATTRDPDYREATLWMGRTLEALGYRDLAVRAFERLVRAAGRHTESYDAQVFMARLLEGPDPDRAVAIYRRLVAARPRVAHGLEAAYRLAGLLEQRGDPRGAYEALAEVDRLRQAVAADQARFDTGETMGGAPLEAAADLTRAVSEFLHRRARGDAADAASGLREAGLRPSRFFTWTRALDLYREAIVRMALLYGRLQARPDGPPEPPAPPRGLFTLDPANPVIAARRLGETEPLFHEQRYTEGWRELFYAVAVPPGHVATGAELRVNGRRLKASGGHSFTMRLLPFPLPRNYQNAWLGTIYGQTKSFTTLHKSVPFFGAQRRMLALQFIENFSEIRNWELELHLVPETEITATPRAPRGEAEGFWEGQVIAEVPLGPRETTGATLPLFRLMAHPHRSLALAGKGRDGLFLVMAAGRVGGTTTDLWLSRGGLDGAWTAPAPMPVNGASEDYAPRLLRAEDGGLRLFWLSNRRGRGWEVWTSALPPGREAAWSDPTRVPLEAFHPTGLEGSADLARDLLAYAVTQDRRGRWLLAYRPRDEDLLVILESSDGLAWTQAAAVPASGASDNLALVQDGEGVYRLGAVTRTGELRLWRSNDGVRWTGGPPPSRSLPGGRRGQPYAAYLFAGPGDELLLLRSDALFGLQYARFDPDLREPKLDLVKDAGLQAFAATPLGDGSYLVALEQDDRVVLRRYRRFQSPDNPDNGQRRGIYTETEIDGAGNRWHRTFARRRFILPDVTAVGVQPDGRVWWGIETGIYSTKGRDVFRQDVAEGFFFHHVTDILPCGGRVHFASRTLDRTRIGTALPRGASGATTFTVESRALDGAEGHVTAMACTADQGLIVGTSRGDLVTLRDRVQADLVRLPTGQEVTAVAADGRAGAYVGTDRGGLYHWTDRLREIGPGPAGGRAVQALARDRDGRLWLAADGLGLFLRDGGAWREIPAVARAFPRFSVAALKADPVRGVWVLPDPETASPGVVHFDGTTVQVFNPPHRRLSDPVDMDLGPDGSLWIGTAFNGLYQMVRASL